MERRFTVVLSADPKTGVYTASCPALPGAITEGVTRERALRAMSEVVTDWLEHADTDGYDEIPESAELVARDIEEVLTFRAGEGWDLSIETTTVVCASVPAHA